MTNPLKHCLQLEAAAIEAAAQRLDADAVEQALTLLMQCHEQQGKLIVSGIGKSGIVGRKIAATFASIGLTSIFLHPTDALHGDLGIVGSEDVMLLLSNSGETDELLAMLPHLKRRGTSQIALVGDLLSSLANACDVRLDGSVESEVCPLNLAPTASTAVAMAIGDALAAVWMQRAGISPAEFAVNHPAGSLGRQLTLTAADLMVPAAELSPLAPHAPLPEVIAHLTRGSSQRGSLGASWVHASGAPDHLAALITDGDLRRTLQSHGPHDWSRITASTMGTTDPITVPPELLAIEALRLMEHNPRKAISVLPVVAADEPQRLLGLLRLHDLVQAGIGSRKS